MKKLLTLFMAFVLSATALTFGACGTDKTVSTEPSDSTIVSSGSHSGGGSRLNNVETAKVFVSFGAVRTMSTETEQYLERTLTATVLPKNATNQKVDYSIAWAQDASLKDSDVTEYVKVIQDSDGSLSATVRCYKSFANDKIVITCTTRDGNKTATCEVTYKGLATSMNISSASGLSLSNTEERGDYYLLYTGNDYDFNVELKDAFGGAVSTDNLQIDYYAEGSVTKLSLTDFYVTSTGDLVAKPQAATNEVRLTTSSTSIGAYKDNNTVALNNGVVKITPNTALENYNDVSDTATTVDLGMQVDKNDDYFTNKVNYFNYTKTTSGGFNYYEVPNLYSVSYFIPADDVTYTVLEVETNTDGLVYNDQLGFYQHTVTTNNKQNFANAYFYVTVTDTASGLTQTIRFWTKTPVQAVNLNLADIDFDEA